MYRNIKEKGLSQLSYQQEWEIAVERSNRFGLTVPPHKIESEHRWFDDKALVQFQSVLREGLGEIDLEDVVVQCLAIHYRMIPIIQRWLRCPVLFTLGWIDTGTEQGLYRFDEAFIAEKLNQGHSGSSVSMHGWLTLPSMEIIDVSLPTSMGIAQKRPEMCGMAITRHADELKGMSYKPMLVGEDFLRKSGLMVEWLEF